MIIIINSGRLVTGHCITELIHVLGLVLSTLSHVISHCGSACVVCTFGVGRSTLGPHRTSATRGALASGLTSGGYQDAPPPPVYLSLSSMAPAYLAANRQLVSDEGRHQLRSATSMTCVARRTYRNYGDRCFAAAGPKLWNSLTVGL